jgi:Holliday junction resolvasome RuvABC DNA-binding subunit
LRLKGKEKWSEAIPSTGAGEALAALVSLGYREGEAREAMERLPAGDTPAAETPLLVREALKLLGTR